MSPAGGIPPRATLHLAAALAILVPATLWASYGLHDAPWPEDLARRPRIHGLWPGHWTASPRPTSSPPASSTAFGSRSSTRARAIPRTSWASGARPAGRTTSSWPSPSRTPRGSSLRSCSPRSSRCAQAGAPAVCHAPASPSRPASGRLARSLWAGIALVVLLASSASRVQIGERYLLPLYPFVILLLAGLATPLVAHRRGMDRARRASGPSRADHLMAAPEGTVSYFNLLAGGRGGGHRVLLDSNLDWGQDLPRLAAWMRAEGVPSVQLAYQGSDDPDRFGIAHEDLPGEQLYPPRPSGATLRRGRGREPQPPLRPPTPPWGSVRRPARAPARRQGRRLLHLSIASGPAHRRRRRFVAHGGPPPVNQSSATWILRGRNRALPLTAGLR